MSPGLSRMLGKFDARTTADQLGSVLAGKGRAQPGPANVYGEEVHSMTPTLPTQGLTLDSQHHRLTISRLLLDRLADHLERLAEDHTLADDQRATADAALEIALIVREDLGPMARE